MESKANGLGGGGLEDRRGRLEDLLDRHLNARAKETYGKAKKFCAEKLGEARTVSAEFFCQHGIEPSDVCLVAVGSVGRREALAASDLDLIPVLRTSAAKEIFSSERDSALRSELSERLSIKVSKGENLTACVCIDDLVNPQRIGGESDNSSELTKRILILTEGVSAGGEYPLREIHDKVLRAYSRNERTRGRHVLSFCNDVARYYRTLCIEYKAKVDVDGKDWCTRNLKLRHSRKIWYFASMISIASLSSSHPDGEDEYVEGILNSLELTPSLRLLDAVNDRQFVHVGKALGHFAWFLEFMSDSARREKLAQIEFQGRYDVSLDNPFPMMKLNSDLLHAELLNIVNSLDGYVRQRVIDWFLL